MKANVKDDAAVWLAIFSTMIRNGMPILHLAGIKWPTAGAGKKQRRKVKLEWPAKPVPCTLESSDIRRELILKRE